jgi:hypothetical protein
LIDQGAKPVVKESPMARTHRVPVTVALVVCLLGGPGGGALFAADEPLASPPALQRSLFTFTDQSLLMGPPAGAARAQAWQGTFNFTPADSTLLAQRGRRGRDRRGGRHSGSAAAIAVGTAAAIAGAAVLVYANRPECRTTGGEGCGYGTKVAGGAVLSAGIVGIVAGALTW